MNRRLKYASGKGRKGRKGNHADGGALIYRKTVGDSFDTFFEAFGSKINEKAEPTVAQFQLGEQLFAVDRSECFDGFQLDNNQVLHNDVRAKANIENQFIVANGNGNLALDAKACFSKFMGENDFVNGFKQARPQSGVNFEGGIKNLFGNLIFAQVLHWNGGCVFAKSLSKESGGERVPECFSSFATFATFA
jgi:hypothetical protein